MLFSMMYHDIIFSNDQITKIKSLLENTNIFILDSPIFSYNNETHIINEQLSYYDIKNVLKNNKKIFIYQPIENKIGDVLLESKII